jgi:CAAX prenyl protease-like protein
MNLGGPRERPLFLHMVPTTSMRISGYWRSVRAPRYSLSFALPLLVAYEALAFFLSQLEVVRVRNGADVLLKSLFVALGGREGLAVFGLVLVGGGVVVVWRDLRRNGRIRPGYFLFMAGEAIVYALLFGVVAGTLTGLLVPSLQTAATAREGTVSLPDWSLPTQLMISLGAGIYEELLFRVLLVSGLVLVGTRVLRWSSTQASLAAIMVGAVIFSAFHYVGPYGDAFSLASFTFRTIAGLLFSSLYILRGFGITAWTHALYDVFLAL